MYVSFILMPYLIGFSILAFIRRWSILLAVTAVVAVVLISQSPFGISGGGPGLIGGIVIFSFFCIGCVSGFLSSVLVLVGRAGGFRFLSPVIVLPTLFLMGLVLPYASQGIEEKRREARNAPPPQECLDGQHSVTIGPRTLHIPVAPSLVINLAKGDGRSFFVLGYNDPARQFCRETQDAPLPLRSIALLLQNTRIDSDAGTTRRHFCSRQHPEYPWAGQACSLPMQNVPSGVVLRWTLSAKRPEFDPIVFYGADMLKQQRTERANGGLEYASKHELYLQRADGFFARCHSAESVENGIISCTAYERMPDGVIMDYTFKTGRDQFDDVSRTASSTAHAILESFR